MVAIDNIDDFRAVLSKRCDDVFEINHIPGVVFFYAVEGSCSHPVPQLAPPDIFIDGCVPAYFLGFWVSNEHHVFSQQQTIWYKEKQPC